jgi:hypothetical protein
MGSRLFFSLFAIGLLAFNFSFNSNESGKENISLKNVVLMQANSMEVVCEAVNTCSCEYTVNTSSGPIIGRSTGPMTTYF